MVYHSTDLVGEYIFSDIDFVRSLSTKNRNVFEKVYNEVKYFLKTVTSGSDAEKQLLKAKKIFEDVYKDKNKNTSEKTQYSIVENFVDNEGNNYDSAVLLDTDFFDGVSPRNWGKKLKLLIENRSERNPFILPVVDEQGKVQQLQFANKKDRVSKNGGKQHTVLGELYSTQDNISKLSAVHIDEIVEVSEESNPYLTEQNGHGWLDENGWLHRNAYVINNKNGNIYQITMDIAKARDGRVILYALNGKTKRVGNAEVNSLNIRGSSLNSNSIGNSIAQEEKKATEKTQFSISQDTEGRTLTKEQQDYFKDSKILDKEGNLKVMYHGSPAQFTVFDKKKAKSSGYYGRGFYFSDSESHAGQYGSKYEVYLNIKNPVQSGTRNITKEQLRNFISEIAENEDYGIENYGYDATIDSVTDSIWGKDDFVERPSKNGVSFNPERMFSNLPSHIVNCKI